MEIHSVLIKSILRLISVERETEVEEFLIGFGEQISSTPKIYLNFGNNFIRKIYL